MNSGTGERKKQEGGGGGKIETNRDIQFKKNFGIYTYLAFLCDSIG